MPKKQPIAKFLYCLREPDDEERPLILALPHPAATWPTPVLLEIQDPDDKGFNYKVANTFGKPNPTHRQLAELESAANDWYMAWIRYCVAN